MGRCIFLNGLGRSL